MKLGKFFSRWLSTPPTREAVIRRYRSIAAREALLGVAMLAIYFTVPAWADDADVSLYSALSLALAGILAALAAATLWSAALLERDVY